MQLERYMSLTEAAKAAGKITNGWSFRGTDDNSDLKTLLAMAEINDAEYGIQPDEYDETFYLLAPMALPKTVERKSTGFTFRLTI